MRIEFLGAFSGRADTHAADLIGGCAVGLPVNWSQAGARGSAIITASEAGMVISASKRACLLLRGHVFATDVSGDTSRSQIADRLRQEYENTGELFIRSLEGSFSVILLDTEGGKVLLYRNLVGTAFTYYFDSGKGLIFGSNLASVLRMPAFEKSINEAALPGFFIGRCVPGRQTLFKNAFRVIPGEMVVYDCNSLKTIQRQTLADLSQGSTLKHDAVEQLEATMEQVVQEHARCDPNAVNLLSGGVDSSYIQAHWNRATTQKGEHPRSITICVDHEMTHGDRDYARSAATALNTDHHELPVTTRISDLLTQAISATAEPPNHLQTAYFIPLAHEMYRVGQRTGLCGQGADALFGEGVIDIIQRARAIARFIPFRFGCRLLSYLARIAGRKYFAEASDLAPFLNSFEYAAHPVNHAGAFAHWPSVYNNFGSELIIRTLRERRQALDDYKVQSDPLQATHAAWMLHDSLDTATLWNTSCNTEGIELVFPFLDSRVIRIGLRIDPAIRFCPTPVKFVLREALARHVPKEIAYRRKLAFGQPVFEWLSPGGPLEQMTADLENHQFLRREVLEAARQKPNWFLYSALCYDIWHKSFLLKA